MLRLLLSLLVLFVFTSCASMMDEMESEAPASTQETAQSLSSATATTDVYQTLRGLAPYWRRCIDPYVRTIPRDEMVELALDFQINEEGRVTTSSWKYMDFPDPVPSSLSGCLDQALRTRRFQVGGRLHSVSRLPIKFTGRRNL